jgi:hypothetical protein
MEHGPLLGGLPLIKGFLCGSLLAGSLAALYGIPAQTVLFVMAALVFLDSLFTFGREIHILGFLASMVIGGAAGLASSLAGLMWPYLLVVFVMLALVYLYEFMGRRGREVKSGVARLLSR